MTDCMHGLTLDTCGICTPQGSQRHTRGPWFTARFEGECDGCARFIVPGDEIRSDGSGGWLCESCG